jgi:lipopolysaccharide/colanic/teichoic acid biosynthesis glycosyltransferase
MLKRIFDIIIAFIVLVLLSPFFVLISVAIVLDTGFPVFYFGRRVGKGGQHFYIIKFRSMYNNAGGQGSGITSGDDPRVTRMGKVIRKWKLDELPQFFNVLKGEMSIVGPRPEDPQYIKYYTELEKSVLTVRPGVTGLTQILFRNEEELLNVPDPEKYYIDVVMHQKLRYDLAYVQNRSLGLDITIIFCTIFAILFPRYGMGLGQKIMREFFKNDIFVSSKNDTLSV